MTLVRLEFIDTFQIGQFDQYWSVVKNPAASYLEALITVWSHAGVTSNKAIP